MASSSNPHTSSFLNPNAPSTILLPIQDNENNLQIETYPNTENEKVNQVHNQATVVNSLNNPYLIEHQVSFHDTLAALSIYYRVPEHSIRKRNSLWTTDSIHSRKSLIIPLTNEDSVQLSVQKNEEQKRQQDNNMWKKADDFNYQESTPNLSKSSSFSSYFLHMKNQSTAQSTSTNRKYYSGIEKQVESDSDNENNKEKAIERKNRNSMPLPSSSSLMKGKQQNIPTNSPLANTKSFLEQIDKELKMILENSENKDQIEQQLSLPKRAYFDTFMEAKIEYEHEKTLIYKPKQKQTSSATSNSGSVTRIQVRPVSASSLAEFIDDVAKTRKLNRKNKVFMETNTISSSSFSNVSDDASIQQQEQQHVISSSGHRLLVDTHEQMNVKYDDKNESKLANINQNKMNQSSNISIGTIETVDRIPLPQFSIQKHKRETKPHFNSDYAPTPEGLVGKFKLWWLRNTKTQDESTRTGQYSSSTNHSSNQQSVSMMKTRVNMKRTFKSKSSHSFTGNGSDNNNDNKIKSKDGSDSFRRKTKSLFVKSFQSFRGNVMGISKKHYSKAEEPLHKQVY